MLATCYQFSRVSSRYMSFPRLTAFTHFLAFATYYLFSRACLPLHVIPALDAHHMLFPRLPPVTCCSRACLPLHVIPALDAHHMLFPRLPPVTRFRALATRYMLFPRLTPLLVIPTLYTRYMFSRDFHPFVALLPGTLTLSNLILSIASLTRIKQLSGRNTSSTYSETCRTSLTSQTCHDKV